MTARVAKTAVVKAWTRGALSVARKHCVRATELLLAATALHAARSKYRGCLCVCNRRELESVVVEQLLERRCNQCVPKRHQLKWPARCSMLNMFTNPVGDVI